MSSKAIHRDRLIFFLDSCEEFEQDVEGQEKGDYLLHCFHRFFFERSKVEGEYIWVQDVAQQVECTQNDIPQDLVAVDRFQDIRC